jgi:DNA-binding NtrC family response regulator
MSFTAQSREESRLGLQSNIPLGTRILIVCDDDSETKRWSTLLQEAGVVSESADSITKGCEAAKSGQFQVVVSTPQLGDGSWRQLINIAKQHGLRFEGVLWVRNFDLREWVEALDNGAFEVLDAVYEHPKPVEAIKCALWMAYLKGAASNPIRNQLGVRH